MHCKIYPEITNKYEIKFNNNIPTWDKLSFENSGLNQSFEKINIIMEVYENNELIYSVILEINGNYYCCGSKNFEFDEIKKTIIKNCNNKLLKNIYYELQNNHKNIFKDTVLDIWITRIFEQLCEY
jgi:hypothetical protein